MKILFSVKPEWEKKIRKGFLFTRHKLYFEAFTPENIRNADLVVPLTITDLRILIQNRHLASNNAIPLPNLKAVDICDDKWLFIQTLTHKGFGYVIPKVGSNLPYPYMLKKKTSISGSDCYRITNACDVATYKDLIARPDFFCQEIINGIYEYATHIIFKNCEIISSLTIEYEYPTPTSINGKEKFIAKNIVDCQQLSIFSAILTSIGFEGQCCFDYKLIEGRPYIFEINPRFGGSVCRYFFSFINRKLISIKK
ncbi:ATP-grasp domain-containing protein [Mucilaginibacter psychrotolerans]|uniref:ATP-grasp domain-containing protein n=1 Tax=Mucilaginibacter psychrotolerans TaxID=1524096 RepID=A0A4Y8SE03_9SPHI|nr:hypothetical protein [Mucilaginibacter psychrotolerans]TFF36840.1 hypothetical protein E2R66_13810 [Mucilaginibacter psychrotolerans]